MGSSRSRDPRVENWRDAAAATCSRPRPPTNITTTCLGYPSLLPFLGLRLYCCSCGILIRCLLDIPDCIRLTSHSPTTLVSPTFLWLCLRNIASISPCTPPDTLVKYRRWKGTLKVVHASIARRVAPATVRAVLRSNGRMHPSTHFLISHLSATLLHHRLTARAAPTVEVVAPAVATPRTSSRLTSRHSVLRPRLLPHLPAVSHLLITFSLP